MIVVMLVTIYTSRVILNALGASDYGIFNVVGGVITLMSFVNAALSNATARFQTYALGQKDDHKLRNTFAAALNLHILVAVLVVIVGETIGLWFLYNKLSIPEGRMDAAFWILQFSIVSSAIQFTQVPYNASLVSHQNMSVYAYVGLYEAISKLAIATLVLISPIDNLIFYGLLTMLNTIAISLFYRYYTAMHYFECHFRWFYEKTLYKHLVVYSGWDLLGGVAIVSQGQGINILLNIFFGTIINAARALAVQIQAAVSSFVRTILTAVHPQVIIDYAEGNYEDMYRLTFFAAKFSFLLMLALVIPVCFEIDFILKIWLGNDVPECTNIFSVIVLITYLFRSLDEACMMASNAIGKNRWFNIFAGVLMVLALPISYILFKNGYASYTAFVIVFLLNFVLQIIDWILLHHYVPFSWKSLWSHVFFPCLFIMVLGSIIPLCIRLIMAEGLTRLILLTIFSEIVLIFIIWILGVSKSEKEVVLSFVKNKIRKNTN